MIMEIDWSGCPIIERDPEKMGGEPTIRAWRITPDSIVDNYESGLSVDEIVEQFPSLPEQDIRTVLNYAVQQGSLEGPVR